MRGSRCDSRPSAGAVPVRTPGRWSPSRCSGRAPTARSVSRGGTTSGAAAASRPATWRVLMPAACSISSRWRCGCSSGAADNGPGRQLRKRIIPGRFRRPRSGTQRLRWSRDRLGRLAERIVGGTCSGAGPSSGPVQLRSGARGIAPTVNRRAHSVVAVVACWRARCRGPARQLARRWCRRRPPAGRAGRRDPARQPAPRGACAATASPEHCSARGVRPGAARGAALPVAAPTSSRPAGCAPAGAERLLNAIGWPTATAPFAPGAAVAIALAIRSPASRPPASRGRLPKDCPLSAPSPASSS